MERFLVRETSGNFSSITASKRLAQALLNQHGAKHDDSTLESREISTLHEKILNVRWWWWWFSRFFFDVFHSLSFVRFSNGDAALIFSSSSHLSCSQFFFLIHMSRNQLKIFPSSHPLQNKINIFFVFSISIHAPSLSSLRYVCLFFEHWLNRSIIHALDSLAERKERKRKVQRWQTVDGKIYEYL